MICYHSFLKSLINETLYSYQSHNVLYKYLLGQTGLIDLKPV